MKAVLSIIKANLLRHKSANISLFIILMVMTAISTIGLSIMVGVTPNFIAGIDRLNSLHSSMIMSKEMYLPEFEEFYQQDSRVEQYEIGEVLYPKTPSVNYGGEIELNSMFIFNIDKNWKISAPKLVEQDSSIAKEHAVYLPVYANILGYRLGDPFTIVYRNKSYEFSVAGFFETSEFSTSNSIGLKIFVHTSCYEELKRNMDESIWVALRFHDPYASTAFNADFQTQMDVDLNSENNKGVVTDFLLTSYVTSMVMIVASLILLFSVLVVLITMIVIRFRVISTIKDSLREIGILKAAGYSNRQMIMVFLSEYLSLSLLATVSGIPLSMPAFPFVREIMFSLTGVTWTLNINWVVGFSISVCVTVLLLVINWISSHKIGSVSPVQAFRGEVVEDSFYPNLMPLDRGWCGLQIQMGIKNMLAHIKQYIVIGFVIMMATLSISFMTVLYDSFVLDNTSFFKIVGTELADVLISVTNHTDAYELAAKIDNMAETRKTNMIDSVSVMVENKSMLANVSDNYESFETFKAHSGRFPQYVNEIAITEPLAFSTGKKIGDSLIVKVNGISLEFIITGFFSTTMNGGNMCSLTLEGYQQFDPNYQRKTINVYLKEGVTFEEFSELLNKNFGVINQYNDGEYSEFSEAKKRAEEKISNHLEQYNIDGIEYAVIYNGEIILSGSSHNYQIEKLTNYEALIDAQLKTMSQSISLVTQVITFTSIIIISLILMMTVKSMVSKRRHDFGTLKSCGYTTKQLAGQVAVSFIPVAFISSLIGCILGGICINPVMSKILNLEASFNIKIPILGIIAVLMMLLTYGISYISALRIRHISVYELLSE